MSLSQLLLTAHIAVFGIWFGTDVATFTLSRRVLDPSADGAVRRSLAGSMMSIEVIARLSLPAMLGLGLCLSVDSGYLDAPRWTMVVIGVATAGWIALVWSIHRSGGSELGSSLTTVDLTIRVIVCVALWITGITSAVTQDGPFIGQWLGAKVTLLAVIVTCGIAIRFMLRPFAAAFAALVESGSSPERELAAAAPVRRAQPLVVVIWACLLGSVALAVTQSVPWSV